SGVQMGMVKIARENNTLLIIPNAGLDAATGALCAPNIFRTSFSNWQPSYPMGKVLADRGIKNVVSLAWKYGAGEEAVAGFTEGFIKAGGKSVRGLWIPFPNVEFQALLTEIASIKPDAVQGYDTALLLAAGLDAVRGDISKRKEMIAAMEKAKFDSPRGAWTMSKAH